MRNRETSHGALRVLMLDNEYPPLGGGTGVVNQRVLEHWAARGDVEVDLVTSSRSRSHAEREDLSPGIRIHKLPVNNHNIHHSSSRELLTYVWRGWRFARQLAMEQHYDACLAWAGVPAGGIAMWLRDELSLPYIVSLQGPDVPGFEQRYRWHYAMLTPFIRRVWRRAARITACSERHRELALRTDPSRSVDVIPNGVDLDCFCPLSADGHAGGAVRLVCVGRLIERKGQQHLLQALQMVRLAGRPVTLTLVGTGDHEAALRQQAAQLGIGDQVHFAGCVPHERMPDLYREADIFVLPSYNEGMSIALLEAMACGLPVVVTDTGGTRELLDGNGAIVRWADVGALAQAITALASSAQSCHAMGERSRALAARYTWARVAEDYLTVCRRVALSSAAQAHARDGAWQPQRTSSAPHQEDRR